LSTASRNFERRHDGAVGQELHLHAPRRHAIDAIAHPLQQLEVDRRGRHGGLDSHPDGRCRGLGERASAHDERSQQRDAAGE
jgi:hypothetical protein